MSTLKKLMFLSLAVFCGGSMAGNFPERVTGHTVTPEGVPCYTSETRGLNEQGKEVGTSWRLVCEVADSDRKVVQRVLLRSGEKKVDAGMVEAFWSVNAAERVPVRWVLGTPDHEAYMETETAFVMPCSGWTEGEFRGVCRFSWDSGKMESILLEGDEVLYVVPEGKSALVYRLSGEFRIPILSEKDVSIGYGGVTFVFADCYDGSALIRCLVAAGYGQEKPHVVFLDGTDGWKIKFVGVTEPNGEEMTVEEVPIVKGWSAYFKVAKDGIIRTATATVLPNGETVVKITENPWVE